MQLPESIYGNKKPSSLNLMSIHDLGHAATHEPQPQQSDEGIILRYSTISLFEQSSP